MGRKQQMNKQQRTEGMQKVTASHRAADGEQPMQCYAARPLGAARCRRETRQNSALHGLDCLPCCCKHGRRQGGPAARQPRRSSIQAAAVRRGKLHRR